MLEESEVICLAFGIVFMGALLFLARQKKLPRMPFIYAGIVFLFGAQIFTVTESLMWEGLFNALEHVCYMLGGVMFALGTWQFSRSKTL